MISIPRLVLDDGRSAMKPEVSIVNSEAWHVGELRKNLRDEDAQEILRFGATIEHGLWISFRRAVIRKTAMIDGEVVAMWGCNADIMAQEAVPWLMTTPGVRKVSPLKFARIYQQEVYKILDIFPILANYVDAGYDSAIRMLDIIGFHIDKPEEMGVNKALYRKFSIRR